MLLAQIENDTQIRNRMIMALVRKLLSEGYKVSADHIGYPNGIPEEYKGYIPDIVAKKDDKELIFEAETEKSLPMEDTKLKWLAFSNKPNNDVLSALKCRVS